MRSASEVRALGRQLGRQQRIEHVRLLPRVHLQEGTVRELARLAWRFEPHGVAEIPYLRRIFLEGYEQGYRLAVLPASSLDRP